MTKQNPISWDQAGVEIADKKFKLIFLENETQHQTSDSRDKKNDPTRKQRIDSRLEKETAGRKWKKERKL